MKILKRYKEYLSANQLFTPLEEFHIEGTSNLVNSIDYTKSELISHFNPSYETWKSTFQTKIANKSYETILKFGDGDYFFLNGIEIGSAMPGKRALSVSYAQIDLNRFREGFSQASSYAVEVLLDNKKKFFELTDEMKVKYFPAEYLYASVANRWFFKNIRKKIAILGADRKLDLIEALLEHEEYREYTGIQQDTELVRIPQKFACDNLDETTSKIEQQLNKSDAEVVFYGVGHVKSGLIPFMNQNRRHFVDIGSSIDALAGIIDIRRPYFGDWTNFRLRNQEKYSKIDLLQASNFGKVFFL